MQLELFTFQISVVSASKNELIRTFKTEAVNWFKPNAVGSVLTSVLMRLKFFGCETGAALVDGLIGVPGAIFWKHV